MLIAFDGLSDVVSPPSELKPETLNVYGAGEIVPL
jgi:hypothetical protein